MQNQLTNKLLKDQKSIEVTAQKNEQLLLSTGNDEYDHIKKAFGLNDTDKVIDDQKRRLIELDSRKSEYGSKSIIDEEFLVKFCLDKGYVLTKLDDYKGKLSKEMLKSIDEYCKKYNHTLTSSENYGFYILCSFSDTNGNNGNLKTSKRYSKSQANKFIILFKLPNHNSYINNHYDYVYEEGRLNVLTNLKNRLLHLHQNQNVTFIFFVVGLIINLGIFLLILVKDNKNYLYYERFPNFMIFFSTLYSIFFLLMLRKQGWLFEEQNNKNFGNYKNTAPYENDYNYIITYLNLNCCNTIYDLRNILLKKSQLTNVLSTIILIGSLFITVEIYKFVHINKVGKIVTSTIKEKDGYTYDVIERKGLTYKIKTKHFKIKNK